MMTMTLMMMIILWFKLIYIYIL